MNPLSNRAVALSLAAALPSLALALAALTGGRAAAAPAKSQRGFASRTYYCNPGKLDDLNKRFREHTCALFQKHGIELIAFWTPRDEKDGSKSKLIYVIAFPSR